ncbi:MULTISPECIES: UDP-N-acetylglucosamine 1-carboxyvinyltransferase [Clostridium]|jgi:UDP-N-acetylglucosamine 1-carboxyvinyltransferase|uniref:UDP-N-acetylglucosamine 1-carboxyvinyltransferase n=4 Tax=root TaxID=1 RepID=C4IEC3_CLOBU|nr:MULTISPECIES: UDP-N-acetylglucosamine 1-carboxyvinyltransferase [Clostridium]ALP89295.1 UDP-N-acetylglucosamine 1-carboxyvinyltransferase [Clostridium butyricum]ALS15759.1 UDP-N-acetylglucosamine 1-carboxyvinyltransferase [Clostridium butyricum]ANF12908.1 UDP-N-acetylglucosamine 1-carboxyvinyltransferase [Clostridium butyricum]AOR92978.1 UDP-N-acetylglucosamine 1-carboxyvinyltransferase [Clostridium butyricum]APF25058.1 UDP-N-acetylglucosamine 1-carboxyvinyltransferase [Clostridium butyricu
MEKIVVKGVKELKGEVNISSAKNSILPIIAATILCPEPIVINNTPMLEDVEVICKLLNELNCDINISKITNKLAIDTKNIVAIDANAELIRKMRASFLIMGPMLARFGYCKLSLPGGCNIGSRPIDLHLKGFKLLGADITMGHGFVEVRAKKLTGNRIYLDFPSVGATENIIMASVLANGVTIIENAAEEPEIWDLANFLNKMGAKIEGAGLGKITITGVTSLKGIDYTPIYDRIEAGTFMIAAAITNSKIRINGVNEEHLRPLIEKLKESGVVFSEYKNYSVTVDGRYKRNPLDIKTLPYPGFPTDMQAQIMSLLSVTEGVSVITETVFENRFMHVAELQRMGANIKIDGRTAIVEGVPKLTGCQVKATDLRAGAAMILGGLVAEGETTVSDVYHIDRGYVDIEGKFRNIGADIYRIDE